MWKVNIPLALGAALVGCSSTVTPNSHNTSNDSAPPFSREEGARIAVVSAQAVVQAVAAIVPIKDLQAIYENGRPRPRCPVMSAQFQSSAATVTLDYGTDCQPDAFAAARFGGEARGTTQISYNGLKYELDQFLADGSALSGSITGGFMIQGAQTKFTTSVDLRLADGATVRGRATIIYEDNNQRLTILESRLAIGRAGKSSQSVTISNAIVDGSTTSSLIPHSGTVQFDTDGGAGVASLRMEFTPSTPLDGTMISR